MNGGARETLLGLNPIQRNVEPAVGQRTRPLGDFSNFVCEDLGALNDQLREGQLDPNVLFTQAETLARQIPGRLVDSFKGANVARRRGALVDLVWVVRSLDIAHKDSPEWKAKRNDSVLFAHTKTLADIEGRHPNLSWSDISLYHPMQDPRTFLTRGEDRDQEVLLYRTQGGIDEAFKAVTAVGSEGKVSKPDLADIKAEMDATVQAVVYLSKVRRIGQFYKLDPFLGANNEYVGHGTGAFSAWSYTAGYFLAGNEAFRERVLIDENQKAFDRDADPYIDQIRRGEFRTLPELVKDSGLDAESVELAKAASDSFALFLRAHRGAIKRHAVASFDDQAPAVLRMDNDRAIHDAIRDMNDGKPAVPFKRENQ